jgi:hypothetical protein
MSFGKPNRNGSADVYITIPLRPGYQGDRSFPVQMDMPSYADLFYLGGENIRLALA